MKNYFVVLLKTECNGHELTNLSNFYFKTEDDAIAYAQHFVATSFPTGFEVKEVMPIYE